MKKNNFNNVFCNRIFLFYLFLPFFTNDLIFISLDHHQGKIFSTNLLFPISKVKLSFVKKKHFLKKKLFSKILLLIFKIGNGRVVKNIMPKKSHDL